MGKTRKFGIKKMSLAVNPFEDSSLPCQPMLVLLTPAFQEHAHGISFEEYANQYLFVFDLTSTHQASHDYLHPELTSASISISLRFDTAVAQITEVLLLGEAASTIYINNSRKVSKNYYIAAKTQLQEND